MAHGDVYRVQIQLALPDAPGTITFHYQQINATDRGIVGSEALAQAWSDQMNTPFRNLLAFGVVWGGVYVRKLGFPQEPPGYRIVQKWGFRPNDDVLPANNALLLNIGQSVFSSARNGRIWIPGIREFESEGNTWKTSYFNGPVAAFSSALIADVAETPNAGLWRLGVLSLKYLQSNPGDEAGAFATATSIHASRIIATQRRRTTKRRGGAFTRGFRTFPEPPD